ARQVTRCPRSTAVAAMQRPSHAVPPRTRSRMRTADARRPAHATQFADGTTRGSALQDVLAHGWQALRAVQVRLLWAFPALCTGGASRPGRAARGSIRAGVARRPGVAVAGFRAGCLR